MDHNNYRIIILTEHCDDEPAILAYQLSTLCGQTESVILEGLWAGRLVYEQGLSYEQALKSKQLLADRGIFAQIQRDVSEVRTGLSADLVEIRQKASVWHEGEVFLSESNDQKDRKEGSDLADGWDALFPDLADSREKATPSPVQTRALKPPSNAGSGRGPEISDWQPAMDTQTGKVASVPVTRAQKPEVWRPERITPKRNEKVERADKIEEIEKSREFDGELLSDVVASRDKVSGPYAPMGYDPRPAHVPLLAAVFSGIAPGAGQIYNGQEETALKYGLRFWWIRPWIQSVRQAFEYGSRIRDYQEPRPDDVSLKRALSYTGGWYLVVILITTLIVVGVGAVWDEVMKEKPVAVQVEVADVVKRAVEDLKFARMSANTAVNKFLDEKDQSKQEFTMSPEERAHRLYVIGYSYCRGGQYSLCEATMRRVTSLGVRNRDAYRLQAWASMQMKEGGKLAMPEISEVPTLFELELHQENDPDRDIVQPALDRIITEQQTKDFPEKVKSDK